MQADIIPATLEHARIIGADPRPADVAELQVTSGATVEQALTRALQTSLRAWTGTIDGVPVCMFGVSPHSLMDGIGTAWMLGSNGLARRSVQKILLRESRPCLDVMQGLFPAMLYNYVDSRNHAAIRWLKWLGFIFLDPVHLGRDQVPFFPFYRKGPTSV